MRILLCHSHYQQQGGEDRSFAAEACILREAGHEVIEYTRDNHDIGTMSRLSVALQTFWSRKSYRETREIIRRHRPQVMHCTNTFPLISPSVYYAAHAENVPVVQSLRNFRLVCCNSLLLRNGRICETCLTRKASWPGIARSCYRESRSATAVVSMMQFLHRALGTWRSAVDLYFTPSQHARSKFIIAGFPADRIAVKPNFLEHDPGMGNGGGGYAVFVGRLSEEKGIEVLLKAWKTLRHQKQLWIIGDGPLAPIVRAAADLDPRIQMIGMKPHSEVIQILKEAECVVMPSLWYETFGRAIMEAFATGTPAVVSGIGAMAELVEDGITGFHVLPQDAEDLSRKLTKVFDYPDRTNAMRNAARQEFLSRYTAADNLRMLLQIYQQAAEIRDSRQQCSRAGKPHILAQNDNSTVPAVQKFQL